VPCDDGAYLVAVIDRLVAEGRRAGAAPSARLVGIRDRLVSSLRDLARVDASDWAPTSQSVVALDAWLTPADAGVRLEISADAVRWHWRQGNLEGRKVGRQVLVSAASIEALRVRRAEKRRSA
jgi:hypothetical protein